MRSKLVLFIVAILVIGFATSTQIKPVKAYTTRIYVNMGGLPYIPGVPPGPAPDIRVDVDIDPLLDKLPGGCVGWSCYIKVDPAVLGVYGIVGAATGYYLYDFIRENRYATTYYPKLLYGMDPANGIFVDVAEFITAYQTLAKGAGYPSTDKYGIENGLCTLQYDSLSQTAYSRIDIYEAYWYDSTGAKYPFDIVEDGHYNAPPDPEFPIGMYPLVMLAAAIPIVYIWREQKRKVR